MTTRSIRVDVSYTKHEIVRVRAPDRPLTPDEIDAIHAAAIAEAGMDDDDDVDVTIIDDIATATPPDQSPDVPEEMWITVGRHRYATTGAFIVREDGPRPVSLPPRAEWRLPDIALFIAKLRNYAESEADPPFDGRYAPLLSGARLLCIGSEAHIAVTSDESGDVVSAVMCLLDDTDPCDAYPVVVTLSGQRREVTQ